MTVHPVLLLLALAALLVVGNWILAAMAANEASKPSSPEGGAK